MFELIEILLSLLFEGILPVIFEGFAEIGFESLFDKRERHTLIATIGYLGLGLLVGALSVWFFPVALVKQPLIPGASLVLSPLAGGITMALFDRLFRKHESNGWTKLLHGVAFTLPIALLRFTMTK